MSRVAVHASADVPAPAERVWEVLVDWPRHAEWVPLTRAEGGAGDGAGVEAWTGVGPVGFLDTMVITEWRPPHRVRVRHTGGLVRGEGRFDLLDLPEGRCRVTWAELLDLPLGPLGRAGWLAIGPAARLMLRTSLHRLANLFE
ncbi:SRPBCC family protein [Actinoallomurus spadix]|uniref:Polyketide cyclase n=1 Tax=Actinoallomurus spadix TaxID=79912 RepID=A0ABP3H6L1_9ACTN|nr:SRPBCC family protein [Actinoallomurus spadix]MCO5988995.1 SRPBCC family protein [Actinoallomurus spadix]